MTLKQIFLASVLIMSATFSAAAQTDEPDNREQWFKEVREYKHRYFAKELDLTRDQQTEFYNIYDKMEDDINKVNSETRALEKKIREQDDVTDLEYDQATQALLEQKQKEFEIESQTYDKLKTVLNKKQLFELRGVERQFTREVMKFHHRNKNINQKRGK